jgi:hypothetical protein
MTKEEFRQYMKAVGEEFENNPGRHLSEDELIEYQRGRLEETEREKVQAHLVQCDVCLEAFKDVNDFFDPTREGEEAISEREIDQEWKAFWQRVQAEEEAPARAPGLRRAGFWFGPRATFALAASVVLAIGFTVFWALQLRQETQQLARQLQTEQTRLKELEQENHRLQEQASAIEQNYESQLAQLRQPQLNLSLYDIYSRESIQRSGEGSEVNPVKVPPTARSFSLILNGEGQPEYPDYVIEIVDQKKQVRWRGAGLRRDIQGNFTMMLDRTFLSPGEYRLKLYGQKGGRSRGIAEYIILLSSQ